MPFWLLRAAFWLLATIIAVELAVTLMASIACMEMIVTREIKIGACEDIGSQIKAVWSESLAAILALLLAARETKRNGEPPIEKGREDGHVD